MKKRSTCLPYVLSALLACFLLTHTLRAQTPAERAYTIRTCHCEDIEPVKSPDKNAISDNYVAIIIDQIIEKLPFTDAERTQFKAELQVIAVNCTNNAKALPCPRFAPGHTKQVGVIRYVFYNNLFLDRLAKNGQQNRPPSPTDYFILAHEIGHHYFNHTHTDTEGQPLAAGAKYDKKQLLPYLEKEKPNHINEFMADAAAVGVLFRLGIPKEGVLQAFRQMSASQNKNSLATDTHPAVSSRLTQAERLWDAYSQKKIAFSPNHARNFADEFYDEDAFKRFAIMHERAFWTVQPGLEGTVGQASLPAGQQPIAGVVKLGGGLSVQVSRKNWYSPHGVDLALGASNQSFSTNTTLGGTDRTIEKFDVYWATLQPTYSFHRIGRRGQQQDTAYHDRSGWFFSIGGTVRVPVKATYFNHATGEDIEHFDALSTTVNPTLRIGMEKWAMRLPFDRRRGSYQLYLSYSPIWLRFRSQTDARVLIHQIGVGLSYGF